MTVETEAPINTVVTDFDKTGNAYKGPATFPKHTEQYFQWGYRWQEGAHGGYGEDSTYYPTQLLLDHLANNEPSLRVLDLCGRALTDKAMEPIVMALKENTTVVELRMSRNKMDYAAFLLVEMVKTNQSVTLLDLKNNDMHADAMTAVAEMIECNSTLLELDLTCNFVKKQASLIAAALRVNRTLQKLRLDNCAIDDEGAKELLDAIEAHPSLVEFSGYNNCCNDKELRKRMRGFKK